MHTWLDDTSLNTADWDCSDTTNFVNILEWETEWLVGWTLWWDDGVKGLEHSLARELALLERLLEVVI